MRSFIELCNWMAWQISLRNDDDEWAISPSREVNLSFLSKKAMTEEISGIGINKPFSCLTIIDKSSSFILGLFLLIKMGLLLLSELDISPSFRM